MKKNIFVEDSTKPVFHAHFLIIAVVENSICIGCKWKGNIRYKMKYTVELKHNYFSSLN